MPEQVECEPPRGMLMRVDSYTVSSGGSIRLVPMQVPLQPRYFASAHAMTMI